MKRQIAASEFKAKCLALLDEVEQSRKELVITKRGRPVARLLPAEKEFPQIFGRMRGSVKYLGDVISPTGEKWDADQ